MTKNSEAPRVLVDADIRVTRSVRQPTLADFERNIDRILKEKRESALVVYNEIKTMAIHAGGLQNSRYPVTVEAKMFPILQHSLADSMYLMKEFFSTLAYPNIKGIALNRLDNHAQNLINIVDEASRQMPALNMEAVKHKFFKEVEDAFEDYEAGFIRGKSFATLGGQQDFVPSALQAEYSFGTVVAWDKERAEALRRLDNIEKALKELVIFLKNDAPPSSVRGIGDNNPPDPIEPILTEQEIEESINTINVYRAELNSSTPRVNVLRQCGKLFKLLEKTIGVTTRWIATKADKFVDGAAATAGVCVAHKLLEQLNLDVSETLTQLFRIITYIEKSL